MKKRFVIALNRMKTVSSVGIPLLTTACPWKFYRTQGRNMTSDMKPEHLETLTKTEV
jgi:hypothetical protein